MPRRPLSVLSSTSFRSYHDSDFICINLSDDRRPADSGGGRDDPIRTGAEARRRATRAVARARSRRSSPPSSTQIVERLAEDGRVELRGFGAFSTRARDARTGRNPRTGETVDGRRQARALFQARQGNARPPERLSCDADARLDAAPHRRLPRRVRGRGGIGRRWRLKIFFPWRAGSSPAVRTIAVRRWISRARA